VCYVFICASETSSMRKTSSQSLVPPVAGGVQVLPPQPPTPLTTTANATPPRAPLAKNKRLLGACLCLLVVIVSWVAQAQLLHTIGDNGAWNKPYQISFWVHSIWVLCLPAAILMHRLQKQKRPLPPLPWRALILYSLIMTPIMTLGACAWYLSLGLTTVSINTGVYNSSFVFVFLFSLVLLRERLTVYRVIGTLMCLGGLALIVVGTLTASSSTTTGTPTHIDSVLGYVFLLASMLGYAMLSVLVCCVFGYDFTCVFLNFTFL
jgi:drug/metabolite transporter (DMT)-like permease